MASALLSLIQWLSPAFPTGGYAYSHGLELAIAEGQVENAHDLRDWLAEVIEFGAGRQDAILLAQGLQVGADFDALDDLARALQPSSERLTETLEQGSAFARTVASLSARDLPARCLPVAVAQAAAPLGLEAEQVVGIYLHAFASNLTSVAMRYMPLGQVEGQGVLANLHPQLAALASEVQGLGLDDLGAGALGADLAAMAHETMDVRIFKT
jgi:urease accessory protein